MQRSSIRHLRCAIGVLVLGCASFAQTGGPGIYQSASVTSFQSCSVVSGPVGVRKFDPSLGVLLEVSITWINFVDLQQVCWENTNPIAGLMELSWSQVSRVSFGPISASHDAVFTLTAPLPAFDQTQDFTGTSGGCTGPGYTPPPATASTTWKTYTSTSVLAAFTGIPSAPIQELVPGCVSYDPAVFTALLFEIPGGVGYFVDHASTYDFDISNGNAFFGGGVRYRYLPFAAYPVACSGDGGNQAGCTDCPCSNDAPPGTVGGCLNSASTSARLIATGDASVSLPPMDSTDLRFALVGAPATALCILNSGDALAPLSMTLPCSGLNSGVQSPFYDGLRCAVTNTRRHGNRAADSNGDIGTTNSPWGGEGGPNVGIAHAGGSFVAGQVRYFQVIHRDDPLLSCMRGLNTTQAVEITFTP